MTPSFSSIQDDSGSVYDEDMKQQMQAFTKKLKVMIVNDEVMQLMILQHILTKAIGIPQNQVVQAISGAEAHEKSMNQHFDILIMDLNMPVLDGFQASLKIRQSIIQSDLQPYIIALSAFVDNSIEKKCKEHLIDLCTQAPMGVAWFKKEVITPLFERQHRIRSPISDANQLVEQQIMRITSECPVVKRFSSTHGGVAARPSFEVIYEDDEEEVRNDSGDKEIGEG